MGNYGIAHTGIMDESNECLSVRVETSVNYESPQIGVLSNTRPAPMAVDLTVTVTGLRDGEKYTLLKFDDETKVPSSNFAAHQKDAVRAIDFQKQSGGSDSYVLKESITTDQKAIYRAFRK